MASALDPDQWTASVRRRDNDGLCEPSNVHPDMSSRTMPFDAIENGHPIA
jgi:hypothetical protein